MKRITALLTALALLMGVIALAEDAVNYKSDFSAGTDGWYARSAGGASVSVTEEKTLAITGRSENWHSMGRDFALTAGERYKVRVLVRQTEVQATRLILSVAHSRGGQETYENITSAAVPRDRWTELSAMYLAGDYDRFVLYVETGDAPSLSYEIKDFSVEWRKTETWPAGESGSALPSLKDAYAPYFRLGTSVTRNEAMSATRMHFCREQFNILTPGNELKPDSVLDVAASRKLAAEDDTAVAVHFTAATPMLNFAKANGIPVHGHTLVWHSQTPEAFFHVGYDTSKPYVTREVMLARLEHYISAVMSWTEEHYPGVIVSWDVVNEAVDDGKTTLRTSSRWLAIVGGDYVLKAFELARKYAPEGVLLYYNDYNTAYEPKQTGIVNLLKQLQAAGVVDGYGFQMHHDIRQPSFSAISASFKRIAALGLRLRISELDVTVPASTAANFEAQAKLYGLVMRLALSYADQVEAVQVWGITDDLSWRATQYPLLFNGNMTPKPAFYAVLEAAEQAK